jgi:hypothetical protein
MGNKALQEQWRARLKKFARSRQSVRAWCAQQDVPVHQFYYWRRRLADAAPARPSAGDNWVAMEIVPEATVLPPAATTETTPGGVAIRVGAATIEVQAGFDQAVLRAVVQALESAPC